MRLNDAIWGALLLLFSITLVVHVQSFPPMPGQRVGPALFPGLIGVGLGICGVLLMIKARLARESVGSWVAFDPWTRSARHLIAFALVIAVNVGYIALVERIGFIPVAIVYLAVLFWIFGASRIWILPIAIAVSLGIHYAFYKLLRVPLPWGMLQRFAW
jgi:putative tricarboxylic transport membrane protein